MVRERQSLPNSQPCIGGSKGTRQGNRQGWALPSVIVDTEKVLREADGSVKLVVVRPHTDGKVFAPGCASKPDGESQEEPEEHKRKEVELVDSVDELRSSSSIRGISMPNFEVLDARIASALNKIIHNSQFKRRISLEEQKAQKEDRFLRGRQIAYLIYDQFRVTGTHDSVENYTDLFTVVLRNDDIQEFDSKWDGILLSMTEIPHDDILEGLYKLRKRESEKLKTVLELYDLETHQKKLGPDYHRLKTMVKRSIEQEIRNKNFGARSGNFEKNAVVKNQGTKQRVQRILGGCWQLETNGQCVKGNNCSFRHDMNKRGKVTPSNPSPNSFMRQNERKPSRTRSPRGKSPSGRMSRWPCKDYLRGTCNNSFCGKWHPPECLYYKTKSGCRFGEKCSFAHRQVDEQPTKRSKTNNDKSAVAMLKKENWQERESVSDACHDRTGQPVKRSDKKLGRNSSKRQFSDARQLGCVFQDMTPPKSILRKSTDMPKPIQRVKFTKAIARHTKIRDQNPWKIGACLHQLLNLRKENLLSTPERQCTWSAKRT